MKKCTSCGFGNDDDARFCAGCGASLADVVASEPPPVQADDPFAEPAAAPADNAMAYEQPPQDQQPQEAKPKKGFKNTVISVKDKTVGFEKKHSIILNAIVLACALVVIFVALFAPIKVVNYGFIEPQYAGITDDYTISGDTEETTGHYATINQSIWQMIGALSYMGADEDTMLELEEQVATAMEEASTEYEKWESKNFDESDFDEDMDEEDYIKATLDARNKLVEIVSDHLSDVNVLGYVLAYNGIMMDFDIDSSEGSTIQLTSTMTYIEAIYSLVFGLVITVLAIVSAIVSLVYLIKAIIGMIKKKPQNKLFKYFGTMLGLSGACILLSMFAPLLSVGGGMFGIAVFISIMYFLCGAFGSFVFGKDGLLLFIKRLAIALFGMIAFFILCTNIFSLVNEGDGYYNAVNGPMGYGWYSFFNMFTSLDGISDSMSDAQIANVLNMAVPGVIGFVTYAILFFAMIFALRAYQRTLKRLAFGSIEKSSCTAFAITGAVFMLIAIIVSMALGNAFGGMFASMIESSVDMEIDLADYLTASWSIRAQVWVSMIFFIIIAVFNIVFNPKSKNPEVNQGQQA